jgi:hypothetical protein
MGNDDKDFFIGWGSGILTFLGIWIGCTITYGFLAFAFAWIPAAIIGSVVGLIMAVVGRAVLKIGGVLLLIAFLIYSSKVSV